MFITANIDPRFRGAFLAALTPENSVEIEEAFVETLSLGKGATLKGGRFFSGIGYWNSVHPHAWDFTDASLVQRAFLGKNYGDDGVQLRWVAPLPVSGDLPTARWSPLKKWVVFSMPATNTPGGTIEYWLDPRSSDPVRIRILDTHAKELIDCRMEKMGLVKVGARLDEGTRMASKVRISIPERQTVMIIEMNAMENRSLKSSNAFDLPTLKAAYPSEREIDLDTVVINPGDGSDKGSK